MIKTSNKNNLITWVVLLIDVLAYWMLVQVMVLFLPDYCSPAVNHHPNIASMIGMLSLLLFSLILPPLIHHRRLQYRKVALRNIFVAIFTQCLFGLVWHVLVVETSNEIVYGFFMTIGLFITLLMFRTIERLLLGLLRRKGRNTRSVLFVGNDPANLAIYEELISDSTTGYRVIGYYSDNDIEHAPETLVRLGNYSDFVNSIDGKTEFPVVDELYCSLSHAEDTIIRKIMKFCDKEVIRFIYVPRIFPNMQLSLKPEIIGKSVVYTNHHEPLMGFTNKVLKRSFDVFFSILALLILLPFIPLIALIVKSQSPGPLLFKQKRTGMNGRIFTCYKFRSMHINDDADRLQATKRDPRKFSFGNFMRKYNIDEMPQFYNVLRSDMSIVGPRPHMTLHTEKYSALIEKYMVRHFAKPGITGLAQVTGYRGETEELWQMEGRIRKDIWYIENWTFWLDIKICFMTLATMFKHDENAY
jgi:putative colanic acid biosynthesis UDP-glucose lipid carrier transferase